MPRLTMEDMKYQLSSIISRCRGYLHIDQEINSSNNAEKDKIIQFFDDYLFHLRNAREDLGIEGSDLFSIYETNCLKLLAFLSRNKGIESTISEVKYLQIFLNEILEEPLIF